MMLVILESGLKREGLLPYDEFIVQWEIAWGYLEVETLRGNLYSWNIYT